MAAHNLPEMPCGPVLELNGQRKRFHVPYGLKPLIENMTREVLRYQPENIYEFLAVFMEARMEAKAEEKAQQERRKSWQEHRWSFEGTSMLEPHDLEEFLNEIQMTKEEAEKNALVIQSAYRGFQARKKVKDIRKSLAMKGGNAASGESEDEEGEHSEQRRKSWEQHRWSNEGKSVLPEPDLEEFLEDIKVDRETAEQHATVIQAAFRGFQARKKVKEMRKSLELEPTSEGDETTEPPEDGEVQPSFSNIEKTNSTEIEVEEGEQLEDEEGEQPEVEEGEQQESTENQENLANEGAPAQSTEQVQDSEGEGEQPAAEVTPDEEGEEEQQPSEPSATQTQVPVEEQLSGASEDEDEGA